MSAENTNDPATPAQPAKDTELDALREQVEALRRESQNLKAELQQAQQAPTNDGLPTTEEGWRYAIQVAQLRAQDNEALAEYLPQLYARYNQWVQKQQQEQQSRLRDKGRLESEFERLGVDPDTSEYRAAMRMVDAGATYEEVEQSYLSLLKEMKVKEAKSRAKKVQKKAAKAGEIEGGEARGAPPSSESKDVKSPDEQFMEALIEGVQRRAPASVRLRAAEK